MPSSGGQLHLLGERRFGPFFLTQFFGAFNDNVFKNALIILIAFQSSYSGSSYSNYIINLAALLFILPFFLFSATAGQIADSFAKADLIRKIKLGEIAIMLFAAVGFYLNSIPLLLVALFFMGTQSSFFGPIKYSIIPEHLAQKELIGGNALVESGTFMAILLGTMLGGILVSITSDSRTLVSYTVITLAGLGYLSALRIPSTPPVAPLLKIRWNPVVETYRNLSALRKHGAVFFAILGISWFWFLGATYITQLPNFTRLALGANAQVVTFFLALLCVGIGVGSLLCERLSRRSIELGLVPIGSIGLTLFGTDIFFATAMHAADELIGLREFLNIRSNWRLSADIFLTGLFGGIYIVPLYAMVQARTRPERRARVIAGNNILNAIAMMGTSIYAIVLLGAGLTIPQLFLSVALLNVVVALSIYAVVPEFLIRFIVWTLTSVVYRVMRLNLENVPVQGPAIIIFEHTSLVNTLIMRSHFHRDARFMTYSEHSGSAIQNAFLKAAEISPAVPDQQGTMVRDMHQQLVSDLQHGNAIGIFLEVDSSLKDPSGIFWQEISQILDQVSATAVPVSLERRWPILEIVAGKPIRPGSGNTE
ncbi:MAG: MFS transporter [Gammaproteobacteria bacterium]|nr:MFS transporter [Gammaproteobacteria bacterium]